MCGGVTGQVTEIKKIHLSKRLNVSYVVYTISHFTNHLKNFPSYNALPSSMYCLNLKKFNCIR